MVYLVTKSGGYELNELNDVAILAVYDSLEKAIAHIERATQSGKFVRTTDTSWYEEVLACPAYGWAWCCYNIEPMEVQ